MTHRSKLTEDALRDAEALIARSRGSGPLQSKMGHDMAVGAAVGVVAAIVVPVVGVVTGAAIGAGVAAYNSKPR